MAAFESTPDTDLDRQIIAISFWMRAADLEVPSSSSAKSSQNSGSRPAKGRAHMAAKRTPQVLRSAVQKDLLSTARTGRNELDAVKLARSKSFDLMDARMKPPIQTYGAPKSSSCV
ncbi:hypothetical protein [Variovorax sp. SRS16]|uniref:hypothetical protein n=1 Tax=Variovorax sp. SRS16 TaxID=282217 RepID=UPI0013A5421F|nr:hypothetical protein [Variovorax sp. SRS16]